MNRWFRYLESRRHPEFVWDRSNSHPSAAWHLVEFDGDPLIWPDLLLEEPPATDTPADVAPPDLHTEPPA